MKGKIYSFESFGTVDGPGIRFVIFMQGCHLQCKYCHNRDTWDCSGGTLYSADEIVEKVENYKNYIVPSGGGVTISGGEPLLQTNFLLELLPKLRDKGFHIAIDTSGVFELTENIKKIINLSDLILLDIKCINDDICKKLTGVSNKKELEFAKYLSKINKPMWVRQVIVPGVTDKKEDLLNLKDFLSTLNNVEKIELLPYHDMGKFKWEQLGLKYPLADNPIATNEDVENVKIILGLK